MNKYKVVSRDSWVNPVNNQIVPCEVYGDVCICGQDADYYYTCNPFIHINGIVAITGKYAKSAYYVEEVA